MVGQIRHMIVENVLQLVASQSCGHNIAGAHPCPPFNKTMSSERTSLIFAPDMEQLKHSEAAESFSSMCNRSCISNLQIQYRYQIVSPYMPTHVDIYVLQC